MMLDKIFKLKKHQTTTKKEAIGGLTTFLTMAYIIFVNPDILSESGMDKNALITATCLAAFIGTLIVAIWANVPFAMAPGMGLNAFFTYTLVKGEHISWETALGVVFLSGVFFLALTLLGVREKIISAIPLSLRLAVAAGIGLFIAFIGFKNMELIISSETTLVSLGAFTKPAILGITGLLITALLESSKVKGGILYGILFTFIGGLLTKEVLMPESFVSLPPSITPIFLKLDIMNALSLSLISAIFSFMFVDLFDSIGTAVACSYEAEMVDKNGKIEKVGKILESDAIATIIGALIGTSTTTTFIESASGISAGARTGLASIFTGLLFLVALFFAPIIKSVPSFATAPALVYIGMLMFKNVAKINYKDVSESLPAFLTIFLMPLTYSISTGISFGFLSYVIIKVCSGKHKEINPMMLFIAGISLLNLYL
ncbi:NCS2 family permease [Aureibacter tunicatorum]|uniref:AGZA family xanthine/uracil permease-like MFS transporter n=1 Tax=Aureibacter tunicatorum TaxID=866807 RepID=A0AAE3XNS3_9BACT|nr:NCS2 family permease [Aureibacter tunicatorum]MDR6241311.1 AGZA family xanthine/uracil permease-like MFS transporter [Aureibacter tunicatorum]